MICALRTLAAVTALSIGSAHAQPPDKLGLGEVLVTANRQNARYAQQDRPVVGLRRRADSLAIAFSINSDSRDAVARKREIEAVLLSALERAASAGIELTAGSFDLMPVTRENYKDLPLMSGDRIDTSRISVVVKTRLVGTVSAAEEKIAMFAKAVPRAGRTSFEKTGAPTLTIVNPDQYRGQIVQMIADQVKRDTGLFGADYAAQVSGIDGYVQWSQISSTEVFVYIPYRYTVVPK